MTTQQIQNVIADIVAQLDDLGTKLTEMAASLSAPEAPAAPNEEQPSAPVAEG